MILQALNSYYERLAKAPDVDIAPFGFSRQQISFCVVLNADGSLHEIQDIRKHGGQKQIPESLVVPGNAKPSGSGINPGFLWDNAAYLLGHKNDDPKPDRTRMSFEAFRARHLEAESDIDNQWFSVVCRFLEKWDPAAADKNEALAAISTGFGVFRLKGKTQYVHEHEAIQEWWRRQQNEITQGSQPVIGQCLVTGEEGPLTRLNEPKIKGVWGAQSAGAAIVSFNLDAFDSYGQSSDKRSTNFNNRISNAVAFQYCTALNRLLARNSRQRMQIGDTTTVFWTEKPTEAENLLPWVFEPSREAEDDALNNRLQEIMSQIAQGKYPDELGDPSTQFYVLGLSPNAARISVRFWHVSSLGELVHKLKEHFADLQIACSYQGPEFFGVWQLIRETVRDSKDIPPLLGGSVMRSILTGAPYPSMLYTSILRRIRADRHIRPIRTAVIKAHLNRNTRFGIEPLEKEIAMSLDTERPETSYHLGRLFAELEKTQEDALPGINTTIKDRYFGAVSATPGIVFPVLIRYSQHHLGKLKKDSPEKKRIGIYHEKRIQEITNRFDAFPLHLSLKDQGLFAIGYYHQRQDIFTKKTDETASTSEKE